MCLGRVHEDSRAVSVHERVRGVQNLAARLPDGSWFGLLMQCANRTASWEKIKIVDASSKNISASEEHQALEMTVLYICFMLQQNCGVTPSHGTAGHKNTSSVRFSREIFGRENKLTCKKEQGLPKILQLTTQKGNSVSHQDPNLREN